MKNFEETFGSVAPNHLFEPSPEPEPMPESEPIPKPDVPPKPEIPQERTSPFESEPTTNPVADKSPRKKASGKRKPKEPKISDDEKRFCEVAETFGIDGRKFYLHKAYVFADVVDDWVEGELRRLTEDGKAIFEYSLDSDLDEFDEKYLAISNDRSLSEENRNKRLRRLKPKVRRVSMPLGRAVVCMREYDEDVASMASSSSVRNRSLVISMRKEIEELNAVGERLGFVRQKLSVDDYDSRCLYGSFMNATLRIG